MNPLLLEMLDVPKTQVCKECGQEKSIFDFKCRDYKRKLFLPNCKECYKILKEERDRLWEEQRPEREAKAEKRRKEWEAECIQKEQEEIKKKQYWANIHAKRLETIRRKELEKLTTTLERNTILAPTKSLSLKPKYPGNEIRTVEYLNVDKKIISFFDGSNLHYYIADWVFAKTDLVKYPIFKGHYVEIKISNGNCVSFLRKLSWKELQNAET